LSMHRTAAADEHQMNNQKENDTVGPARARWPAVGL
jgi:hypothetical protein